MSQDVTLLLERAGAGDKQAQNVLAPLLYDELKARANALMRRERSGSTIQATVLVSEAFMRLVDASSVTFENRAHFYALASRVMRQVLVDHARARQSRKRGGGLAHVVYDETRHLAVSSDDDVLALEAVLERLAEVKPRYADIVTLRFFGGMTMAGVAETLGLSKRTLEREWTVAKAWIRREMAR